MGASSFACLYKFLSQPTTMFVAPLVFMSIWCISLYLYIHVQTDVWISEFTSSNTTVSHLLLILGIQNTQETDTLSKYFIRKKFVQQK
jgi:hypothetical protein